MRLIRICLIVFVISAFFGSCEKEQVEVTVVVENDTLNAQKGLQENILGVWKSDAKKMLNNGEVTRYNYIAFNENGICTSWQGDYENGSLRSIENRAYWQWFANGNKGISIYWPSGAIDVYYITIDGDKMSVSTGSLNKSQSQPFGIDTDNGISTWKKEN